MKCPNCRRGAIQRSYYGGDGTCSNCGATFDASLLNMMVAGARFEAKHAKVNKSPTLDAAGKPRKMMKGFNND